MAYELREGNVSIFKNKNKTEDKHPEYKGELMINGVICDIALWVKEGQKGKFFSGKVTVKSKPGEDSEPVIPPATYNDLPF